MASYRIVAPFTPGADPSPQGLFSTLAEARREARNWGMRRDLTSQDVRIERASGRPLGGRDTPDGRTWVLAEYAGPCR